MELSDPATPDMNATARKSGRSRQKPVLLNKDPNIPQQVRSSGAKRKRAESRVEVVSDPTDDDMADDSNTEESDPDEEELKEQRRKSRNKKVSMKPIAKKPKTVPALITNLAVRPAVNGVKKASKPKQPRARPVKNAADDGTGLYGQSHPRSERSQANRRQRRSSLKGTSWTLLRPTGSRDGSKTTQRRCATWSTLLSSVQGVI